MSQRFCQISNSVSKNRSSIVSMLSPLHAPGNPKSVAESSSGNESPECLATDIAVQQAIMIASSLGTVWSCDNLFILAFWRHCHIPIMIVATTPDTEQIRSITSHAHMPITPLSPNKHSHTCLFPTCRPARCDALVLTILIVLCILRVVLETDNADRTRVLKSFF